MCHLGCWPWWICACRKSKLIWPFRVDAQEHLRTMLEEGVAATCDGSEDDLKPHQPAVSNRVRIVLGQHLVLGGQPAVRQADNDLSSTQDGSSIASATWEHEFRLGEVGNGSSTIRETIAGG